MDKWVSTKAIDYMDDAGRRYGVTAFFFEDKAAPWRYEWAVASLGCVGRHKRLSLSPLGFIGFRHIDSVGED